MANVTLLGNVCRIQARNHGRYWSPRMLAVLRAEGRGCSFGRVVRLMRRHGIRALAGRRFRPCTTDSRHYLPIAPNLLTQRFIAPAPNRIWLADITSIATGKGWLYTGGGARSCDAQDRWLGDARPYAYRFAAGSIDDGRAAAKTNIEADPSFRKGEGHEFHVQGSG